MKKRQNGFMLVETLVVSTLVSTVLIALYVQFNNIVNNFNRDFHYNNVDNLYATQNIKNFILKDADGNFYKNLKSILEQNIAADDKFFLKIVTDCTGNQGNYIYQTNACNEFLSLTNFYQIKQIIFTREVPELRQTDYELLESPNFVAFIKSIKANPDLIFDKNGNKIYNYRVIVEFENNEYATLTIAN